MTTSRITALRSRITDRHAASAIAFAKWMNSHLPELCLLLGLPYVPKGALLVLGWGIRIASGLFSVRRLKMWLASRRSKTPDLHGTPGASGDN